MNFPLTTRSIIAAQIADYLLKDTTPNNTLTTLPHGKKLICFHVPSFFHKIKNTQFCIYLLCLIFFAVSLVLECVGQVSEVNFEFEFGDLILFLLSVL